MLKTEIETIDQVSVFKRQFQQLINRNQLINCLNNRLEFLEFEVIPDKNRIVKRPGYEILLENVDSAYFVCSHYLELQMTIKDKEHRVLFKIP